MVPRLRRFFDVRAGEGLRVLLSFLYIAVVVAAFLLAKPIRNGLFLQQYGPYALVYVYAAVPLALSLFVPVYSRVAARFGSRAVTVATLVFFSLNVVAVLVCVPALPEADAQPGTAAWLLPGVFYVWVNCFGVIAPVQAWSFANSLFDTRQARRLFGLIGAGASLGAIGGGLLARFLVGPVGGTVNLMLVLAALILLAAAIVIAATARIPRRGPARRGPPPRHPFRDSMRQIGASPYLRLMAALVFLVAIATQWTAFQLSLVADRRFGGDADALTVFFGTFNFALGAISFLLQLLFAGPALRRFGVAVTILVLPLSLGFGSLLILLLPGVWTVLLTNGLDQGAAFLARQGDVRAAVSAAAAGAARADQEHHRYRRQPRSRTPPARCCSGWRPQGFFGLRRSRRRAAGHGGHQPRVHRRLVRRRVAASRRVRAHDPADHPAASDRHRADAARARSISRPPPRLARRSVRSMSPRCAMRSICSRPSASTRACCRASGSC